jgi:DMSO/TMAO reductase YedYZ molybdopterin-dependent catalytic subunit
MIKSYLSLCFMVVTMLTTIPSRAQLQDDKASIDVKGEVAHTLKLYVPDLEKMKQVTVTFKGHNDSAHLYAGVSVMEILNEAGVTTGKELHGQNMSKYLLVAAADGYKVLFSLAELDSVFNDKQVMLAYRMDGKPLPASKGSFQLIVPGEKKPARSCFRVNTFIIGSAKD